MSGLPFHIMVILACCFQTFVTDSNVKTPLLLFFKNLDMNMKNSRNNRYKLSNKLSRTSDKQI